MPHQVQTELVGMLPTACPACGKALDGASRAPALDVVCGRCKTAVSLPQVGVAGYLPDLESPIRAMPERRRRLVKAALAVTFVFLAITFLITVYFGVLSGKQAMWATIASSGAQLIMFWVFLNPMSRERPRQVARVYVDRLGVYLPKRSAYRAKRTPWAFASLVTLTIPASAQLPNLVISNFGGWAVLDLPVTSEEAERLAEQLRKMLVASEGLPRGKYLPRLVVKRSEAPPSEGFEIESAADDNALQPAEAARAAL